MSDRPPLIVDMGPTARTSKVYIGDVDISHLVTGVSVHSHVPQTEDDDDELTRAVLWMLPGSTKIVTDLTSVDFTEVQGDFEEVHSFEVTDDADGAEA